VTDEEAEGLDRTALLTLQLSLAGTFGGIAIAAATEMDAFYRWLFAAGAQFLVVPALLALLALSPWEPPATSSLERKRTLVAWGLVSLYVILYAATLAGAVRAISQA
jgi:hypothetical protein